jgi:hypothetical protein
MELHAMDIAVAGNRIVLVRVTKRTLVLPGRLIFETLETRLCGLADGFAQFRSTTGLCELGQEVIKLIHSIFEIHR